MTMEPDTDGLFGETPFEAQQQLRPYDAYVWELRRPLDLLMLITFTGTCTTLAPLLPLAALLFLLLKSRLDASKVKSSEKRPLETNTVESNAPSSLRGHFDAIAKASPFSRYGDHCTYTFAAPRLGNADFADAYSRAFPDEAHHWAVQAASDAVCHLPFAAWGFRHPDGVIVLPDGCSSASQRLGDRGDNVSLLRPKGGHVVNWAITHDMANYIEQLKQMTFLPPEDFSP